MNGNKAYIYIYIYESTCISIYVNKKVEMRWKGRFELDCLGLKTAIEPKSPTDVMDKQNGLYAYNGIFFLFFLLR